MKELNIKLPIFILMFFSIVVLINDYFSYIFNCNYYLGMIISFVLTLGISFLLRKKLKIDNYIIEKEDIIFFVILVCIFVMTIVFPDRNYDSLNYHIYSQVRPFNSIINGDFFPSSELNSFTFSYGDRLFYIFRLLLGFRLGLLFNYICLIILYYQVKELIKKIGKVNGLINVIIASVSIFTLSIIDLLDSYYIDLLVVVFMLEIINIIIGKEINKDNITKYMFYVMLLFGLLFSLKISNAYFIILFGIILLIKNRKLLKNTKLYFYPLMIFVFVFPFILYMIYSYKETGNPFFPFYNTIFKSSYFPNRDWMDLRFGPKTLLQFISYPILIYLRPEMATDNHIVEPMWGIFYVVLLTYNLYYFIRLIFKKSYNKNKAFVCLITLISLLIWEKMVLGYTRYALFILIIGIVLLGFFIHDIIKHKYYIFLPFIGMCLIFNYYYTFEKYVKTPVYLTFNNIFANNIDSYKYNLERLFDHDIDNIDFPTNSIWGISNANSGYMYLLNDEIKMYSLRIESDSHELRNKVDTNVLQYDNIYTILDAIEIEGHIRNLNNWGYEIEDIYDTVTPSFLNYNNYLYIFKVKKSSVESPNRIEKFYMKYFDPSKTHVEFYVGPEISSRKDIKSGEYIKLIGKKKNELTVLKSFDLDSNGKINKIDIDINDKYDELYVTITDKDNNIIENRPIIYFDVIKEGNNEKK